MKKINKKKIKKSGTLHTPITLEHLKKEILINQENLHNIDNIAVNSDLKQDLRENLLDEKRYLLDQHRKHLDAIVEISKRTAVSEEEADKIRKDISTLTSWSLS